MPVSTGNIAISTCMSLQGTQSAASRFTLHRHPSCGNEAPNVADMRLNAAHESTELMSLTKHPQKHATTCRCGLIRLQDKTKKGIPLKPGCLPMYLYNLSPAEDSILATRPGHGIGYTHLSALRHVILQHRHIGCTRPARLIAAFNCPWIQYRGSITQLHSTQDYGRGRAAEHIGASPTNRICEPGSFRNTGFLQQTPLPGRLHARPHTSPNCDNNIAGIRQSCLGLPSCAYVRLPDYAPASTYMP